MNQTAGVSNSVRCPPGKGHKVGASRRGRSGGRGPGDPRGAGPRGRRGAGSVGRGATKGPEPTPGSRGLRAAPARATSGPGSGGWGRARSARGPDATPPPALASRDHRRPRGPGWTLCQRRRGDHALGTCHFPAWATRATEVPACATGCAQPGWATTNVPPPFWPRSPLPAVGARGRPLSGLHGGARPKCGISVL